ncbi:MAG: fatty acid desaturase family protein [Myxococcota bacterium]
MKVNRILTREEIQELTQASDPQGWLSVVTTWGLIALSLAVAIRWPNPATVLLALIVLGGRQLALAVLMHECAHRSLFRSRSLNEWVGYWLCGTPVWLDMARYRVHHLGHHAHAGSERDPDLSLARGFPVSRTSFLRKVARDILGISGLRRVFGLLAMDAGYLTYSASDSAQRDTTPRAWSERVRLVLRRTGPVIAFQAALFGVLAAFNAAWAYGLWVAAYLTTFSLFLRLRAIAEHACTAEDPDPIRHTRTVFANVLARMTVAPHHVNYHTEHHLLPTAPHYRLVELHQLLHQRGAFADGNLAASYGQVWSRVTLEHRPV